MTYTCIGKKRQQTRNDRYMLIPCKMTSETATWRDVFLCADCANGHSQQKFTLPETKTVNVGAMQTDEKEYKDIIDGAYMDTFYLENEEE